MVMKVKNELNIGLAGVGTVGKSLIKLIEQHKEALYDITGKYINVVALAIRNDRKKEEVSKISNQEYQYYYDLDDMALASDVDVIVELVGGTGDLIVNFLYRSLENDKHVVTANKSVLAEKGKDIFHIAQQKSKQLRFEGAVLASIPIAQTLINSALPLHPQKLMGICNGTCNYILSEMQKTQRHFTDILLEAQEKGYAEADPTLDVDGIDAAHKIAILSSMVFKTLIPFDVIRVTGIRHITLQDVEIADQYGYCIKLLGVSRIVDDGVNKGLIIYVAPTLVSKQTKLAQVNSSMNAIVLYDDIVGEVFLSAAGAGGNETANAVLGDIVSIANDTQTRPLRHSLQSLKNIPIVNVEEVSLHYYVRISVSHVDDITHIKQLIAQVLTDNIIEIKSISLHERHERVIEHDVSVFTNEVTSQTLEIAFDQIKEQLHSHNVSCMMMIVDD